MDAFSCNIAQGYFLSYVLFSYYKCKIHMNIFSYYKCKIINNEYLVGNSYSRFCRKPFSDYLTRRLLNFYVGARKSKFNFFCHQVTEVDLQVCNFDRSKLILTKTAVKTILNDVHKLPKLYMYINNILHVIILIIIKYWMIPPPPPLVFQIEKYFLFFLKCN